MSEQEMEFADPDWKPGGQTQLQDNSANEYFPPPRPVNRPGTSAYARPEQVGSVPSSVVGTRKQSSQGYNAASTSSQIPAYTPAGETRRRGKGWIWIVVIVLCIGLFSGMSGYRSSSFPHGSAGPVPAVGYQQTFSYMMAPGITQIQVADSFGSVHFIAGDPGSQELVVNADSADKNAVQFIENQGVLTINLNPPLYGGENDITIMLPTTTRAGLNVTTTDGDIEVDNYKGQLTAQSDAGSITLNQDSLDGQSTITSGGGNVAAADSQIAGQTIISSQGGHVSLNNSSLLGKITVSTGNGNGDIDFYGTLDPRGSYQFTTAGGNITLNLPGGTAMNVQYSTGTSGSYASDFSASDGTPPQSSVNVRTDSGAIHIYKQNN